MRVWAVAILLAVLPMGGVLAGDDARYRLVAAETAEQLQRRLGDAAGQGYRLVATTQGVAPGGKERIVVLMEHDDTARLAYRVVTSSGDFDEDGTREQLASLGADGYSMGPESIVTRRVDDWYLPESAYADQMFLILEQDAAVSSASFDYATLSVSRVDVYERELVAHVRDGYEILGMWYSGRRLRTILRRDASESNEAPTAGTIGDRHYRLLIPATKRGVKGLVKRATREGYRVIAATDQTIQAPPILLVARIGDPDERVKVKFLRNPIKKLRRGKLARKLNKKARGDFRVIPGGVTSASVMIERVNNPAADQEPLHYVALSTKRNPDLFDRLETALSRQATLIVMFHEVEETTFLLVDTP